MDHICVPTKECKWLIQEAHYSNVVSHFGLGKTTIVFKKIFLFAKDET